MKSHSEVIRAKLALVSRASDDAFERLWARAEEPWVYPAYVLFLHQMIRGAVPLLEAARRRAAELAAEDPMCGPLAEYLEQHIDEERGHDLWALADLADLGIPAEAVLGKMPPSALATLVGAQYYWVEHHHPAAILGYITFLEDSPPCPDFIADLQRRTGAPSSAFRCLSGHAAADPGHRDDIDRLLDRLPLSQAHHQTIGVSLIHTASAVADCIERLTP